MTDSDREEVFERIPWETLERPARDNSRVIMAVAGAVVLGALGFSFVRNQPVAPPASAPPAATAPMTPPATVAAPILRSEADLYAVDEERLAGHAAAHAEWFAVEYISFDGSDSSRATLEGLLPVGVPLPEAPTGTQVYVDWVGTTSVSEVGALAYEVELIVRSMAAAPGEGFVRRPPARLVVDIMIGPDGAARVVRPPRQEALTAPTPTVMGLTALPDDLKAEVESLFGPVVGGEQLADGRWRVVVMTVNEDGVTRPRTVVVP